MTDPEDSLFDPDVDDSLIHSINELYDDNKEVAESIDLLEEEVGLVEDPVGIYITLFDMYNDLENIEEAGRNLVEAARRVDGETHADLCYFLYNQLELFAQLNPEASNVFDRLGSVIHEAGDRLDANTLHLDQRKLYQADLIPEILLANHLHRSRHLADDEYRIILQDLCWCVNRPPVAPRTVLYVLEDRGLPHHDKAIEFLAHDASASFIHLSHLNLDERMMGLLDPEFCRRRAAAVVGDVGGEPLVATLNPYNLQLREDVENMMDAPPHFFLTCAAGYQLFLDKVEASGT